MIRLKSAVIVEGKYDKITLDNILDATIIRTDGFKLFKDREKQALIRTLSKKDGVIVMTDSDSAGRQLRALIKRICVGGKITNVYIPEIKGKEKRKEKASKEGLLGVEGLSEEIILKALEQSGITAEETTRPADRITATDLYNLGLSGRDYSKTLRENLCTSLGIPRGFRGNSFLDLLNTLYSRDEFLERVKIWLQEADKK